MLFTLEVLFRGYLPAKVKSSNSVFELKTKIKNLGNIDCGCLISRQTSFTTVFDLLLV